MPTVYLLTMRFGLGLLKNVSEARVTLILDTVREIGQELIAV